MASAVPTPRGKAQEPRISLSEARERFRADPDKHLSGTLRELKETSLQTKTDGGRDVNSRAYSDWRLASDALRHAIGEKEADDIRGQIDGHFEDLKKRNAA